MFSLSCEEGGDSTPLLIQCDTTEFLDTLYGVKLNVDGVTNRFDSLQFTVDTNPNTSTDTEHDWIYIVEVMDPTTKQRARKLLPKNLRNILSNNPSISITPSSPKTRQPAVTFSGRPLRTVPITPPISIVPVSCKLEKSVLTNKITNTTKRTAPIPVYNKIKCPRLNSADDIKPSECETSVRAHGLKSNLIINNKNENIVSSTNLVCTCTCTSIHVEKCLKCGNSDLPIYTFMDDGQFKIDDVIIKKPETRPNPLKVNNMFIRTSQEIFNISRSVIKDEILKAVGDVLIKTVSNEELATLKSRNALTFTSNEGSEAQSTISTNSFTKFSPAFGSEAQSTISTNSSTKFSPAFESEKQSTISTPSSSKSRSSAFRFEKQSAISTNCSKFGPAFSFEKQSAISTPSSSKSSSTFRFEKQSAISTPSSSKSSPTFRFEKQSAISTPSSSKSSPAFRSEKQSAISTPSSSKSSPNFRSEVQSTISTPSSSKFNPAFRSEKQSTFSTPSSSKSSSSFRSEAQSTISFRPSPVISDNIISNSKSGCPTKLPRETINLTTVPSNIIPSKSHDSTNSKIVINYTSLKQPMATATIRHIDTSIKHVKQTNKIINGNQPPMAASTTIKVPNTKSTNVNQLVKVRTLCIKCGIPSEDEVCQPCRMSSQLKNVTVTRIETPCTSAISPERSSDVVPIHAAQSPTKSEKGIVNLLSDEDEDSTLNAEMASRQEIREFTDQLCLKPRLLDEYLWKVNLSAADYFKTVGCHTLLIGSFRTKPAVSGDMLICVNGVRMTVQNIEYESVIIDIQMKDIVKIAYYYEDDYPVVQITSNYISSAGIQYLLSMSDDDKSHYYDSRSQDPKLNSIIWFFDKNAAEKESFERLLPKLPERKIESLTAGEVHSIRQRNEEEIRKIEEKLKSTNPDSIEILDDKVNNIRFLIYVADYKMLNTNEFVNDNLIEYYLNYCYGYLCEEDKQRTFIFGTHFYTQLTNPNFKGRADTRSQLRHGRIKKWTKNVNIFQKDFIFIPIHDNNHWYLAVICFPYLTGKVKMKDGSPVNIPDNQPDSEYQQLPRDAIPMNPEIDEAYPSNENLWLFDLKATQNYSVKIGTEYHADVEKLKKQNQTLIKQPCILIFDSLSPGYHRARVATTLREWLDEEYKAKHNGEIRDFSSKVVKAGLVKVPQQPNSSDCGFFVMHFFQKFFDKPIVDYNLPISHLENWFPVDEVSKNCQKRTELQEIILTRMGSKIDRLPAGMALPLLDFREITNGKTHYVSSLNLADYPSTKPTLTQNAPKQQITRQVKNEPAVYYDVEQGETIEESDVEQEEPIEESGESTDEDVNNQYNENDHYDDSDLENNDDFQYFENENEEYSIGSVEAVDEEEAEDYRHNMDDGYHHMRPNNGNVLENIRPGSRNYRNLNRIQNISNENSQPLNDNNIVYHNDDEEYRFNDNNIVYHNNYDEDDREEEEDDGHYYDDENMDVDQAIHYNDDDEED